MIAAESIRSVPKRMRRVLENRGQRLEDDRKRVQPVLLRDRECLLPLGIVLAAVRGALAGHAMHRTRVVPLRAARHFRWLHDCRKGHAVGERGRRHSQRQEHSDDRPCPTRHTSSVAALSISCQLRRIARLPRAREWRTDYSARIAIIGCTAAARRADGMPARTATKNAVAAAIA